MSAKRFAKPPDHLEPLFKDVPAVGLKFRPDTVTALFDRLDDLDRDYDSVRVVLRHEADNEHDPSAHAVDIVVGGPGVDIFHIGYVPRKLAKVCHLKRSAGLSVSAYLRDLDYEPEADVPYAVRFDLYEEEEPCSI